MWGVIPERCDPGRMRASAPILSGFVQRCVDALVSGEVATGPLRPVPAGCWAAAGGQAPAALQ